MKSSEALGSGLARDLEQARDDFARGDFIDITSKEFDQCIAAGKWP